MNAKTFCCIYFSEDKSLTVVDSAHKDLSAEGPISKGSLVQMMWKVGPEKKKYDGVVIDSDEDAQVLKKLAGEASKWLLNAPDSSSEGIIQGLLSLKPKDANASLKRPKRTADTTVPEKRKFVKQKKQDPLQQNVWTENKKVLQHKVPEIPLSGTAKLINCASQTILHKPEDVTSIPVPPREVVDFFCALEQPHVKEFIAKFCNHFKSAVDHQQHRCYEEPPYGLQSQSGPAQGVINQSSSSQWQPQSNNQFIPGFLEDLTGSGSMIQTTYDLTDISNNVPEYVSTVTSTSFGARTASPPSVIGSAYGAPHANAIVERPIPDPVPTSVMEFNQNQQLTPPRRRSPRKRPVIVQQQTVASTSFGARTDTVPQAVAIVDRPIPNPVPTSSIISSPTQLCGSQVLDTSHISSGAITSPPNTPVQSSGDQKLVKLMERFSVQVPSDTLRKLTNKAKSHKSPGYQIVLKLMPVIFSRMEMANSRGQGLKPKGKNDIRPVLEKEKIDAIKAYSEAFCRKHCLPVVEEKEMNLAITEAIGYARRKLKLMTDETD